MIQQIVLRYYRCTGADGYRFNGQAVCDNGAVRGDQLEQVVWNQVRSLMEQPDRVADEYRRRIGVAQDGAAMPDEIVRLGQQMTTMRRGIGRLIDSYAEGLIDKAEFEPRIAGLKQRLSQLQERHRAALDAIEAERSEISLNRGRHGQIYLKPSGALKQPTDSGNRVLGSHSVARGKKISKAIVAKKIA